MKDAKILIGHILEACGKIREYIKGMDEKAFLADNMARDAVLRNIEIIGEAAKGVTYDFRSKHMEIEWKEMAGMRDRIVHAYFEIDWKLVWETASKNVPELEEKIRKLV